MEWSVCVWYWEVRRDEKVLNAFRLYLNFIGEAIRLSPSRNLEQARALMAPDFRTKKEVKLWLHFPLVN